MIPPDAVVSFLDALLEDYADEWLTKAMFHYRWAFEPDIAKAGTMLPRWGQIDAAEDVLRKFSECWHVSRSTFIYGRCEVN